MKQPLCTLIIILICMSLCAQNNTVPWAKEGVMYDSISYHRELSSFTGYYPEDKYDKISLDNWSKILSGFVHSFRTETSHIESAVELEQYYKHMVDSLSKLNKIDSEPLRILYDNYIDWGKRQFKKDIIICKGYEDYRSLYSCDYIQKDSVMIMCVDILVEGGDNFVENTRQFFTELYMSDIDKLDRREATSKRYATGLMKRRLSRRDSTERAVDLLMVRTIGNRINGQIHDEVDYKIGDVYTMGKREFDKLFDYVREFDISVP